MKKFIVLLVACSTLAACKDSPNNTNPIIMDFSKPDALTYPAKMISVSIDKPAEEVYQFAANPENFPRWIAFIKSMKKQEDVWIGKTDQGDIKIKFVPRNEFGIIDHEVTFPNGEVFHNPMRAISNNKGCEFTFTLFRMPGKTDQEFNEDAKAVTADLQKLKEVMEQAP